MRSARASYAGMRAYRGPSLGEKCFSRSKMTTLVNHALQKVLILLGPRFTSDNLRRPSDNLKVDKIGTRKGI